MRASGKDIPEAFTIIELLLVVAIIALLATLGFAVYQRATFQAEHARLLHNKEAVILALKLYYEDNGQWPLPTVTTSSGDRMACLKPEDGTNCFDNPDAGSDGVPGDNALLDQLAPYIKPLPLPLVNVKTGYEGYNVNSFVYLVDYSGVNGLQGAGTTPPGVYLFWVWPGVILPEECPAPSIAVEVDPQTPVWICQQWVGPIYQ